MAEYIDIVTISMEDTTSTALKISADRLGLGAIYDNNAVKLKFIRPTVREGQMLTLYFMSGNTSYAPHPIGTSDEFIVPNSLTQNSSLRMQLSFASQDHIAHSNVLTFTFDASIEPSRTPIEPWPSPIDDLYQYSFVRVTYENNLLTFFNMLNGEVGSVYISGGGGADIPTLTMDQLDTWYTPGIVILTDDIGNIPVLISKESETPSSYVILQTMEYKDQHLKRHKSSDEPSFSEWLPQGLSGASIRWRGEIQGGTIYYNNSEYIDAISYQGSSYICKTTHTENVIPNVSNEYWDIMASKGEVGPIGNLVKVSEKPEVGTPGVSYAITSSAPVVPGIAPAFIIGDVVSVPSGQEPWISSEMNSEGDSIIVSFGLPKGDTGEGGAGKAKGPATVTIGYTDDCDYIVDKDADGSFNQKFTEALTWVNNNYTTAWGGQPTIYIRQGTYNLTEPLDFGATQLTFAGAGRQSTVLRRKFDSGLNTINIGNAYM